MGPLFSGLFLRCDFSAVDGEIIKILFMLKNVGHRADFMDGKTLENDGPIDLCCQLGAALRVDAIGLALAAFLGLHRDCKTSQAKRSQEQHTCCWLGQTTEPHRPCATTHSLTSKSPSRS